MFWWTHRVVNQFEANDEQEIFLLSTKHKMERCHRTATFFYILYIYKYLINRELFFPHIYHITHMCHMSTLIYNKTLIYMYS